MTIEELVTAGEAAFQMADFQEAVDRFEEAYQQEQSVDINVRFVASLEAAGQFEQAYRIATELPWSAYQQTSMQETFMRIALRVDRPIAARKMLAQSDDASSHYQSKIEQHEQTMRETEAVQIKTLTREFYHLGELTIQEQQQRLNSMEQLPLREYVFGAKGVLIDPFANALIRSTVFHSLQQLRYSETVDMLSVIAETNQVIPSAELPIEETTIYQSIVAALTELEQEMDPMMWQGLYQQTKLTLQMIAPFQDDGITQPSEWVADMRATMFGMDEWQSDEKQHRWQQATLQAISELF